jgi:hypothetical protein
MQTEWEKATVGKSTEPKLYNPKEAKPKEHKLTAGVTYAQVQELLQKIAWKVGLEKYGLKEHEFEFSFTPGAYNTYKIMGGAKVHVFFSMFPTDQHFKEVLHRALDRVRAVKQATSIQLVAEIQEVKETLPRIEGIACKVSDVEVECYRVVKVIHKKTGLISVKQTKYPGKSWTKLIVEGRIELGAILKKVEEFKDEQ